MLKSETGTELKWAIAGRSKEKLEEVLANKKKGHPTSKVDPTKITTLTASLDDDKSLDALCKQASIILALAGPYIKCGPPLVAACLRNETHYLDITGEFQFIRQNIEKHHKEAAAKAVSIIHCCGFDCVPSDVGSLMMHDHVANTSGAPKISNMVGYYEMRGTLSVSGGTAHSMVSLANTMTSADLSPVSLNPSDAKNVAAPTQKLVGRTVAPLSLYTAPLLMAATNERVVRRSNALMERPNSVYYEAAASKGLLKALGNLATVYLVGLVMAIMPLRWLCTKFLLPMQGQGPSAEEKKNGGYTVTFVASADNGTVYKGVWEDSRNMYDCTAVFMVEAAATLLDIIKSNNDSVRGGVLTPASALGMKYAKRLLEKDSAILVNIQETTKSK